MSLPIPLKLLLSLVLGAVIGLERESYERKIDKTPESGIGSLGVRTFSLITLLGGVAGLLKDGYFSLFLIVNVTFMTLLVAYYIIGSIFTKDNGITTEIAILFGFLVGIFISLEIFPIQIIIALVVILIFILSIKERVQIIVSNIKENELSAFLSYAIIALVILPFLPNISYTINDIPYLLPVLKAFNINIGELLNVAVFNPFNLWKVVVIITGVDLAGYFFEKTIGQKKGWLLTSLAGGFISSTSTTQSLSQKSRHAQNINLLVAAAIFANLSSFIQHLILIASINVLFLSQVIFYVLMIISVTLLLGLFFLNQKDKTGEENLSETKEKLQQIKIFSLGPALKFAFVFLGVTIVTKISLILFGQSGFLISSALAALTGLDAVTINASQMAGSVLSYKTALLSLIFANAVNLTAKSVYGFLQGKKSFAIKFSISMIIIVIASFLGLIPFL